MFQGLVLGIETSCDETAVAVVDETGRILANVLDSQVDVHARYGGVVPELASRRHMECLENLTKEALKQAQISISQLKGLAVTNGPGLVGALIVGVNFGKSMAYARRLPLVAVNHLEGHLASAWLADPDFPFPALVLIASGGHTHLALVSEPGTYQFVGWTIDDAAGEAFDKGAKMLGLPYPGGPAIETLSLEGSSKAIAFPRPNFHSQDLLFSFSGLKTALLYYLRDTSRNGGRLHEKISLRVIRRPLWMYSVRNYSVGQASILPVASRLLAGLPRIHGCAKKYLIELRLKDCRLFCRLGPYVRIMRR